MQNDLVAIEIDGRIYQVKAGINLLQACLSEGLDLPYFCWHPAMGSVGACRQCAVIQYQDRHDQEESDQHDDRGRIVMGCMTPVSEGMRVSIDADNAKDFRSSVVEFLMTNHPHDCPVCEEGGECHLQDMTVMTGHTDRKYRGEKRTHQNQYLGPFINHEMNRCIACYRCVRFYNDYAGGDDLQAMAAHNHVYFGRHEDGALENVFSGNLVEVCPTGVFTDKTLAKHYSRKWDLQAAPSICQHCSLGCNTSPGERYGKLRRVVNRYNDAVNGYFLCDRGRFGYEHVNRDNRLLHAFRKPAENGLGETSELARADTRSYLSAAVDSEKQLVGIGSSRASLESNFALRELVGEANFYAGMTAQQGALESLAVTTLRSNSCQIPTLSEVESADAMLILGEDVLNTQPRLALALRQASGNAGRDIAARTGIPSWQDEAVREIAQATRTPCLIMANGPTGIDDIATNVSSMPSSRIALVINAAASHFDSSLSADTDLAEHENALVTEVVGLLETAQQPLIVSGVGSCSLAVIQATANLIAALAKSKSNGSSAQVDVRLGVPDCNSVGLSLLVDTEKHSAEQALARILAGDCDTLIVLEQDLYRLFSQEQIQQISEGCEIVQLDLLANATTEIADLVLPSAAFSESEGTLVSSEGRAQRYFAVHAPKEDVRSSWEWLADMIALRDQSEPRWQYMDDVTRDCAAAVPALSKIVDAAPDASYRIKGMKIARQPHRYSGRTAMLADQNVSEPKQPVDEESALAFSMEGFPGEKPASLTPYYWSPGWNSNQAVGKFQEEVNGPLKTGVAGVCLFETDSAPDTYYAIAAAPSADGGYIVVPRHHVFGGEELSGQAPGIAERSLPAYAELSPSGADDLGVKSGDGVLLDLGDHTLSLEVLVNSHMAKNEVAVPYGFHETAGIEFLRKVAVEKDVAWQPRSETQVIASDGGNSL